MPKVDLLGSTYTKRKEKRDKPYLLGLTSIEIISMSAPIFFDQCIIILDTNLRQIVLHHSLMLVYM